MKVASRSSWTAPSVERAVAAAAALLAGPYIADRDFRLVTREPGSVRRDLPIWESTPGVVRFDADGWGPVQRDDVPDVPGAFVLSNILSSDECEQLLGLSSAMGWTEDAPVSLGRQIRQNENCVWIADDSLWAPIWTRLAPHMPVDPERGAAVGLNQRWRLYRYDGANEDVFRMHTDGDWPGSAVVNGKLVRDAFGDRWSQLTLLLYLDDDYDGGHTTFFVPHGAGARSGDLRSVRVPRGGALAFWHGEHPLSLLHEGSPVTRGVKTIVRSDVLYMVPGATCPA